MAREIRAAVCEGNGAPPIIETLLLGDPATDELVIEMGAAGICHTDIGISQWAQEPLVFGHEGAGTVIETGSAVTKFKSGDRMLGSFDLCGPCPNCNGGSSAYCFDGISLNIGGKCTASGPPLTRSDGSVVGGAFFQQSCFAAHALVTERNIVAIPDKLNFVRAAPLGCGIQTGAGAVFNQFGAEKGRPLVICGCGTVGVAAVMAGKIRGYAPIIAIDLRQQGLALALKMGANPTINGNVENIAEQVIEQTKGGATAVLDSVGTQSTFETALAGRHSGGTLGVLTLPGAFDAPIPYPGSLSFLTTGIAGIMEGNSVPDEFLPKPVNYHFDGMLPHDRMIETFDFANTAEAFAASQNSKAIKPVLAFDREDY